MNKIIGKVLPDGSIKHITLYDEFDCYVHGDIAPILKNFYSWKGRLDALLDLGNLYKLNPNPTDKFNNNINDTINCKAAIRDRKQNENKHGYIISKDKLKLAKKRSPAICLTMGIGISTGGANGHIWM